MGYIKTGSREFFVKKASGTSLQHEPRSQEKHAGGLEGPGDSVPSLSDGYAPRVADVPGHF